jgi:hypothetical protein
MLYRNASSVDQTFYDQGGGPNITIPPGWVYSSSILPMIASHPRFVKFSSFADHMDSLVEPDRPLRVGVVRSYALGDVIMVVSILRTLRKVWPNLFFDLYTEKRFTPMFAAGDEGIRAFVGDRIHTRYALGLNLDGVLEKDHSVAEYSRKHRLLILAEFLGVEELLDVRTD